MSAYTIKHTDPARGSFAVSSDQIDGTMRPWDAALYTNPVSSLTAVSSNSSLVFAGLGITNYGELIQNNFLYLMEHFSYRSRPLTPSQGQIWYKNADYTDPAYPSDPVSAGLYVYNGMEWTPIFAANTAGNISLGDALITNLGDAVSATDALNLRTADARYLALSGGTVTGSTTFTAGTLGVTGGNVVFGSGVNVTLTSTPTSALHVANKTYVDASIATVTGLVSNEETARINADGLLAGSISSLNTAINQRLPTTGGTITGTLTLDQDASLLVVSGGTGTITAGFRRIEQIDDPVNPSDAASKSYVDSSISAAIGSVPGSGDGVVSGGSIHPVTGLVTLTRTQGLSDIVIPGFAPATHSHTSTSVSFDMTPIYSQSYLTVSEIASPGYPNIPVYNALKTLDTVAAGLSRPVRRLVVPGDGSTTLFNLGTRFRYVVNRNRLQVFKNGVKQYASERGESAIAFTNASINPGSPIGVLAGTYSFNITVNGTGPTTVNITVTTTTTYLNLASLLTSAFSSLAIPATVSFDQFSNRLYMLITSTTCGVGSGVTVSFNPGELFAVIPAANAPENKTITVGYAYEEVGSPGSESTSIQFTTAPSTSDIVEILIMGDA